LKTDNQANVVLTIDIEALVDNAVGGTTKALKGKTTTLVRREVEAGQGRREEKREEEGGVHDLSSSEIPTYFLGLVPSGVFSMKMKTVVSVQCVVGTNYWDLASEASPW
jgi:hypothetical protein